MTAAVAVGAIDLYQRFLSPYKGFRCAHGAVRGRCSCSQFAKRLVEKVGLLRFAPLFMGRLRRCGEAARALKAGLVNRRCDRLANAARESEDERRRRKDQRSGYDTSSRDWSDCADCGSCDVPDVSGLGDCAAGGCDLSV